MSKIVTLKCQGMSGIVLRKYNQALYSSQMFSYAKDMVNEYKICKKLSRKKALRKELKKSEEEN